MMSPMPSMITRAPKMGLVYNLVSIDTNSSKTINFGHIVNFRHFWGATPFWMKKSIGYMTSVSCGRSENGQKWKVCFFSVSARFHCIIFRNVRNKNFEQKRSKNDKIVKKNVKNEIWVTILTLEISKIFFRWITFDLLYIQKKN